MRRNKYLIAMHLYSILLLTSFVAASAGAQTQAIAPANNDRNDTRSALALASRVGLSLAPSDVRPVPDNSTRANIVRGSSASPDALAAMIETTLGGLKFPDGTEQKPAAGGPPLFTVDHDQTLQGDGTSRSPLGIKVPLNLNGSMSLSGSLTAGGTIEGKDIVSNNSLTVGGDIRANTILTGNNFVSGLLDVGSLIRARGTPGNNAVEARGGDSSADFPRAGLGVRGTGGKGLSDEGGRGVEGDGGDSDSGNGGIGVGAIGGLSTSGTGGTGVLGRGGSSLSGNGGVGADSIGGFTFDGAGGAGVRAVGGSGLIKADGGPGVSAVGGNGNGPGRIGGIGIIASGGAGVAGATRGLAGSFQGDVEVTGNLSKGGGSFKIDHPLDPANKYLYHSFVESPDMLNIYNGTVTTDANGDAVVELPGYFGALNRDFRYQLTVIGAFAQAIVAEKVRDNHFRIKTNSANVEVSWQVTGVRQDAYANKNRIPVEQDKPEQERGFYLHPDAFDQPEGKSVLMVQHPEILRQINEAPEKAQKEKLQ